MTKIAKPTFIALLLALASSTSLTGQPRLVMDEPASYQPGDYIDSETWMLDENFNRVQLLDVVQPETRVVVLILFGGAALELPSDGRHRSRIWCEDSFDDLGIQRAVFHAFREQPVQFIPVAVPPVYHSARYGFGEDVFLSHPDDSKEYRKAARAFIEATEAEQKSSLIPFERVFYDPKLRLFQNKEERTLGPEYGEKFEWQGKLKWHLDPRTYGTPTIWILDREGKVLREPFIGNDYDREPPEVNYGFSELQQAVDEALNSTDQE